MPRRKILSAFEILFLVVAASSLLLLRHAARGQLHRGDLRTDASRTAASEWNEDDLRVIGEEEKIRSQVALQQRKSSSEDDKEEDDEDDRELHELDHLFEGIPIRRRLVDDMFPDETDDELIKVFVAYRSARARRRIVRQCEAADGCQLDPAHDFPEIGVVAVELTKVDLRELEKLRGIKYIERNEEVYAGDVHLRSAHHHDDAAKSERQKLKNTTAAAVSLYDRRRHDYLNTIRKLSHGRRRRLAESVPYGIEMTWAAAGIPARGVGDCRKRKSFKVAIGEYGLAAVRFYPCI